MLPCGKSRQWLPSFRNPRLCALSRFDLLAEVIIIFNTVSGNNASSGRTGWRAVRWQRRRGDGAATTPPLPSVHLQPAPSRRGSARHVASAAAAHEVPAAAPPGLANQMLVGAVEALFKFPPIFRVAVAGVRQKPCWRYFLHLRRCCRFRSPHRHCHQAALPQNHHTFRRQAPQARNKIVQRGRAMGLDFEGEMRALQAVDWGSEMAAVEDRRVQARRRRRRRRRC